MLENVTGKQHRSCNKCSKLFVPEVQEQWLCIPCIYEEGSNDLTTIYKEKVNHPSHYGGDTTYEVIKVIEAWGLGFHDGNMVKYVARAGKKGDKLEDLKKAKWYLDRLIEIVEKEDKR